MRKNKVKVVVWLIWLFKPQPEITHVLFRILFESFCWCHFLQFFRVSKLLQFPIVNVVQNYRLPQNVRSFYNCNMLILGLGNWVSHSNLVRYNICNFTDSVFFWPCSVFFWYMVPCESTFSLIYSFVHISASRLVFFLFFIVCALLSSFNCFLSLSKSPPFISLSHNFLTVIDFMNFHMISSVPNSEKIQLFSNWIIFSQWSSDVSVSDCFAQNNLVNNICFFPVTNICCWINSSILFYSSWAWHSDRDVWCVASGPNSQSKSCSLFSSFVFQFVSVIVRSFIDGLSHAFFGVLLQPFQSLPVNVDSFLVYFFFIKTHGLYSVFGHIFSA